jgi:RNA polymerase sigma-70 factor (ECF subfamily)
MTSESDLIERSRCFDQNALGEIYDRFSPGIYRYALHLLGDPQQAEDCTEDTFTRYLQALRGGGGPKDHLQAYLYRIAHNQITDSYRRQPPPMLSLFGELPGTEPELVQTIVDRIEKEQVQVALLYLTPEQRQVIVLKYLEGFENDFVALALKKPVGAIKSLQHRALITLRRILLSQEEEVYERSEKRGRGKCRKAFV